MPIRAPALPVSSWKCRFIMTSFKKVKDEYGRAKGKCGWCVRSIDKRGQLS